ncbi:MAG: hypothetical protein HUK01_05300 [Bacteroidaceae bacterium]|nr:hypothetical protein [Bacteroidaceae bacterium]
MEKEKNEKYEPDEGTALVAPEAATGREPREYRNTLLGLLGGGLIGHEFLRRNWGVIAVIILLTIIYVSNRYAADQEMIQISDLQKELEEVRYRALTHNSELTMLCRQSQIEAALAAAGDSTLKVSGEPAFIIRTGKK